MPIGITDDHRALAESCGSLSSWADVVRQGIALIAVPEETGGAGGTVLDLAVALEACARTLLPGPLLGTATAATVLGRTGAEKVVAEVAAGAPFGIGLGSLVYDAGGAERILAGTEGRWYAAPAALALPVEGVDLSRSAGHLAWPVSAADADVVPVSGVTDGLVRRMLLTLAAAEAAGVASWCLRTAVDHAKVREQFGQPIGRFQAVKHLLAAMAETVEAVTAAAWDVACAADGDDDEQWAFAVDVAGAVAFDGAVSVAQDCIQVLGGIGFTYEHDAHRYLRRATALRSLVGGRDRHALSLARRAVEGTRRRLSVDLPDADDLRSRVRARVAEIAEAPDRRAALVETGFLVPHWPAPYGLGASPVEQLVIDEELAAARIERPDLKIGGWAAPTILRHGTDEQRERFVRPTLEGRIVWCQLFSEPGAGSDLASLRTRAERVPPEDGGGWRLTGQKVWTSLAAEADWAICLARTNPEEPRHQGITYFLVDMRSEGIDVRPLREMTGDALFNEVFLDDVLVPDECVVGEVDGGWALARTTLANERVAMASARLGTSVERAVELAPAVGDLELVRIGHAVALATVCAQLGMRVVLRTLADAGPGAESSVAKLLGVRSRQDASELVVELLGPAALLAGRDSEDVHEMLLTRCLSIAGGTTQILRNVVAERILGLPR